MLTAIMLVAVLLACVFSQKSYATYKQNITPLAVRRGCESHVSYSPPPLIATWYFVSSAAQMHLKAQPTYYGNVATGDWWVNNKPYPMENVSALVANVTVVIPGATHSGNDNTYQLRMAIAMVVGSGIPPIIQNNTTTIYTELDFWDSPSLDQWNGDWVVGGDVARFHFDDLPLRRQRDYSVDFVPYIERTLKGLTSYGILMNDTLLETYVVIESINSTTESWVAWNNYATTATLFSSYSEHLNSTILKAWGATYDPLSPNWNPAADINKDKAVNIVDMGIYGKHYQDETWCKQALNNYLP